MNAQERRCAHHQHEDITNFLAAHKTLKNETPLERYNRLLIEAMQAAKEAALGQDARTQHHLNLQADPSTSDIQTALDGLATALEEDAMDLNEALKQERPRWEPPAALNDFQDRRVSLAIARGDL